MYFSLEYTTWQLIACVASLILTIVACMVFIRRVWPLKSRTSAEFIGNQEDPDKLFSAAIIVYSKDEAGDLAELIPLLMEQEYAPGFEVIVVNEGQSPAVREVVSDLQMRHPNLHLTGTPDGARSLSRKKLAITLGIKATRKPVVVLTTACARPAGKDWLHSIMRNFDPDGPVEVVLGYATAPDSEGTAAGWFDHVASSARWLSPAILGTPWRGTEHNLAYRTDIFFRNKGFSRQLNLRHGDDDIFVSEIARSYNTAVELAPESRMTVPGCCDSRSISGASLRRSFTERFISQRPKVLGATGSLCYLLSPLAALAIGVLTPGNWGAWLGALILLALWYAVGLTWIWAFKALGARRLRASLPLWAATHSLRQSSRALRAMIHHGKRYTWE
ncbi:MAG: hypothetical protein K2M19_01360 [Muribaculaceae bacterium]|nr:hypothetical protein [Muribaculaceae bacterium]